MLAGAHKTADDILRDVDLAGLRVLVTGVSSGVGMETARALVARGVTVLGTVRSLTSSGEALATIHAAAARGGGGLTVAQLDLSSLTSVRACADRLLAEGLPLDAVIANAGVMATPLGRTSEGFETQFGTNHLGHFVLVNRLAALIASGGRMISLSSNGHRGADVDLEDPNYERTTYDRWQAYGRSKTANILFAVEFDQRHRDRGVRASAVMPGTSETPLLRHLSPDDVVAVFGQIAADRAAAGIAPLALKSPQQMAATSVWALVADADRVGGRYLENCAVAAIDDVPGIRDGVMSYALDRDRARHLWCLSEELVGERFDFQS
ncbi:SDR family NAD(P)-dependent oxidoreductase [Sphingomonas sp. UV9]|uniref:SDR family NAD(P)-dependent oxidoreductase n=1 Tax=Sphingomonas sp. UV9 TaxID=1851410 RepID=UPI001F0B90D8|nr:SDR family NAD(P)-dependent oxidoreductase [Sphingomonas sp. UV9]